MNARCILCDIHSDFSGVGGGLRGACTLIRNRDGWVGGRVAVWVGGRVAVWVGGWVVEAKSFFDL